MNQRIELSILVPTTEDHRNSRILRDYLQSQQRKNLGVQFVFLLNDRKAIGQHRSEVVSQGDHEIVVVANDRYFGACEDNLYRVQDFGGLLKPIVFSVGGHDSIDWEALQEAVEHFVRHRLGALAWNLMSEQKLPDGRYAGLAALTELSDDLAANNVVRGLTAGEIMPSNLGNAAMTSTYGPIDWQAYLGCHLLAREVFLGLLQYHFGEAVYSLVYKQATYFHHHPVPYAYWSKPIIHRRSDDFNRIQQGNYSSGWLADHRTTAGASPIFWIANMRYMTEMRSDVLFNLFASSLTLTHVPAEGGGSAYTRMATLGNLVLWSAEVVRDALARRSHYFPDLKIGASLRDLRCVADFWQDFLLRSQRSAQVYSALPREFLDRIADAAGLLRASLASAHAPSRTLDLALNMLGAAASRLTPPGNVAFNQEGFHALLAHLAAA